MQKLIIRNIGPVKEVNIELNKLNVFIGPQSSGKSTIAKIISFCSWLEKANSKGLIFNEENEAYRRLQSYHRLSSNYFSENSYISYQGDNINYEYDNKKEKISYSKKIKVNPKVIYIPAERNFVSVIPNLSKYNEDNDNIIDFLKTWLDSKRKYESDNKLHILNMDAEYYSGDLESDNIITEGVNIPLRAASSGLQSVVPMLLLIDWLSEGIYKENKPLSYNESQIIKELLDKFNNKTDNLGNDKIKELLADFIVGKIYTYTQFIIEEPEQNLFPTTQCDLLYFLLKSINHGRKHRAVITTHSPYILYALNNCMLYGDNRKKISEEVDLKCKDSWILSKDVSVWQIEQGELIDIIDKKTNSIGSHYFNDIMNNVMDDFYKILSNI